MTPKINPITRPHTRQRRPPPPKPIPDPHHTPRHHLPHRPNPTPCTTPQRYDSTSGDSGTRRCCASALLARPSASGGPPWSRRPPWGKAPETSSSTPSSTSPNTTAPHSPSKRREPAPHGGPNLGPPHGLGATPSRTPRARAGGHQGPQPLPRAQHGPTSTQRHPQRHQRIGKGNMGRPDGQLEQLQAPRPGGRPHPRRPAASALHVHGPHVQSTLHPLHHPLQSTNWPLVGARHRLPPPRRLHPPPTAQTTTRTPGGTRRTTPTSGARGNASSWTRCSPSTAATRALVGRCIALPRGPNGRWGSPRTDGCGRSRCAPSRGRPPPNRRGPVPPRPTSVQLPVHGGSPPHGAAVAGPRHSHPKLPPPHGGGHARHPAMLLPHPRLPPANAPTRPGADMATLRVTHMPAQPRQRHNTATCTYTGTGTHRSPGKAAHTPSALTRILVLITRRTQHPTPAPAAQGPPPSPTALSSASDSTTSTTTTTSSSSTPPPKPREKPRRRQDPRPNEGRARGPAETQDRRQAATRTHRRAATATRSQAQAQAKARHHDGSASLTPPRSRLRNSAQAIPGPEAAAPSTAPPHRHRRRRHHLHGKARRGRSATHFVQPPLEARTPGPRTTPDRTGTAPGSTSCVPAPLPTLDVSPRTANAPLLPLPRVPTEPRGGDRARIPASPHPPAPPVPAHPHSTKLRGISQARHRHQSPQPRHTHPRPLLRQRPRPHPGTVVAALDPHAALGAAKVGPGTALPRGPFPPAPRGVGGNLPPPAGGGGGCRKMHGKPCWPMRSTPWESTPATSPRPSTTRMSSGACGRPSRRRNETAYACGTSPKAHPRTHTPSHHPISVGAPTITAPTAPQEPCAPHSTTGLTPQPAAPPPNPVTQPATAAGCHAGPGPEDTKRTGSRRTPTRRNRP